MNQTIEKIDQEVKAIVNWMKTIVLSEDIYIGFLAELTQVAEKRISELVYMKNLILAWTDPEDKFMNLKMGENEPVFIRSRTDGNWVRVIKIGLIGKEQIFTTEAGQKKGEEYKLVSYKSVNGLLDVSVNGLLDVKVEKVKG